MRVGERERNLPTPMAVTPGRRGSARVVLEEDQGMTRAPHQHHGGMKTSSTSTTAEQRGSGARRRRAATDNPNPWVRSSSAASGREE